MRKNVALVSVVPATMLREFEVLKYSFELFHPGVYQWFIRCDNASRDLLSSYDNLSCTTFCDKWEEAEPVGKHTLLEQKMHGMDEAWQTSRYESVILMSPDIIFTHSIMEDIDRLPGDVVFSPNYFPPSMCESSPYYGYFNSGFVVARSNRFHSKWLNAFLAQPWRYLDQGCLNDIASEFSVATMASSANVGAWRSSSAGFFIFDALPADCLFVRVPLFARITSTADWVNKAFGLHCLKYLRESIDPKHRLLHEKILELDKSGWYQASIKLCSLKSAAAERPSEHEN